MPGLLDLADVLISELSLLLTIIFGTLSCANRILFVSADDDRLDRAADVMIGSLHSQDPTPLLGGLAILGELWGTGIGSSMKLRLVLIRVVGFTLRFKIVRRCLEHGLSLFYSLLALLALLRWNLLLSILTVTNIVLDNGVKDGNTPRVYLQGEKCFCITNYIATIIDMSVINGHMLLSIYWFF